MGHSVPRLSLPTNFVGKGGSVVGAAHWLLFMNCLRDWRNYRITIALYLKSEDTVRHAYIPVNNCIFCLRG